MIISQYSSLIGMIVKEWYEWVPALAFIPLSPLWVWVLDSRWESIFQRLFPDSEMIYSLLASLPAVDILLLSRI